MSAPLSGNETRLLVAYDFNEGVPCDDNTAITQVIDKGPFGINGTLTNFDMSSCSSNYFKGRNLDSDNDGIGDACDILDSCVPDYANQNIISGTIDSTYIYETDGIIESVQNIESPADIQYTSATEINLLSNFEVGLGVKFHAFINGCAGMEYDLQDLIDNAYTPIDLLNLGYSPSEIIGLNYQGGIIFKIESDGTGLVAAPVDQGVGLEWGCYQSLTGSSGYNIGDGEQNTIDILAACPTSLAALACASYNGGGHNDWYFPSFDEVLEMKLTIGNLAPFPNTNIGNFGLYYWTSTETSANKAWGVTFNGDYDNNDDDEKSNSIYHIRAIRAF